MTPDPSASADSNNPQSWNQYAYSYGHPVNNLDPSGLYPCGSTTTVSESGVISVTVYDCGNFGTVFPGGAVGGGPRLYGEHRSLGHFGGVGQQHDLGDQDQL